ncbi:YlbG family protein [uncultured Limosilactobacillus sp.]|uniref:YlbG family protein n=1 Tax=uncultured Limosilactobacillus sp. TaxID=2837629 RepID=UPI0025D5900F|nr:YlbG family protein [uncultured Limosilactobacillus sp.]
MFSITKRQGLIIYVKNAHVIRRLRHYGHVIYFSRRFHYVILYVNQTEVNEMKDKILALRAVKDVQLSEWPNIDPTVFRLTNAGIYKKNDEDE